MLSSINDDYRQGLWAWERGLLLLAEECWEQWLERARAEGDVTSMLRSLNALGCVHYELGRMRDAEARWQEAHALIEQDTASAPEDRLKVLTNLAVLLYMTGRVDEATLFLRAAQRCGTDDVPAFWNAHADHVASIVWMALEHWDEAEVAARRALAVFGSVADHVRSAQIQTNLGLICLERREYAQARAYLEAAREVLERLAADPRLGYTYCALGRLHYVMGDLDQAATYGSEALRVLWSNVVTLHKSEVARVSELFGYIALATGDRHGALMELQRASTYYAQSSMWGEWSRVNRQLDELVRQRSLGTAAHGRMATIHPESKERLRYFTTLLDLLDSIESLYPDMRQKAELTGRYAHQLGQALGLSPEEQEALSHVAKLHDIGLTSLDPEVVERDAPLSPAARERMMAHPLFGEKILSLFAVPELCRDAVRHHHERYDGLGFPDGLRGEEIPLLARIIAVAGTYVSHGLERGHTAAIVELRRRRGTQLDPRLVDVFVAMHDPVGAPVGAGASLPRP